MEVRPALGVKIRRELTLTQRMRQALAVLQMDVGELAMLLREALSENPFLEEDPERHGPLSEGDGLRDPGRPASDNGWPVERMRSSRRAAVAAPENGWDDDERRGGSVVAEESWRARILREFRLECRNETELRLAEVVLGSLDERGYLAAPPAEIAASAGADLAVFEEVRRRILQMDPGGLGARDLRECLQAQLELRHPGDRLAARVIAEGLELVARGRMDALARKLRARPAAVRRAAEKIRRLWPDPAGLLSRDGAGPVLPDLTIERVEDRYVVSATEQQLPRLRIVSRIPEDRGADAEARAFIAERLTRARWLLANVAARRRTLIAVARLVAEEQAEFFAHGLQRLRPLSLRQAADKLGLHESTVARAVRGKYVQTPRGMYALRFFFAKGVVDRDGRPRATPAVTRRIRDLIAAEERNQPLTDRMIAGRLRREGIRIARRTVTKYRDSMRIPTAGFRRRG